MSVDMPNEDELEQALVDASVDIEVRGDLGDLEAVHRGLVKEAEGLRASIAEGVAKRELLSNRITAARAELKRIDRVLRSFEPRKRSKADGSP